MRSKCILNKNNKNINPKIKKKLKKKKTQILYASLSDPPPYSSSTSLSPTTATATAVPPSSLSPTILDALPRFQLKRSQPHRRNSDVIPGGDDDCVVCLDAFKDAQWCRKLSTCGHVFHMRCVDSWLAKVAACPICRAPVRSNASRTGSSVVSLEEEEKNLWGVW